jgi:hypothetical protein
MTTFLAPWAIRHLVNLILADPKLVEIFQVGWNPLTGEPGIEEAEFALGLLDVWSEEHRATIETGLLEAA